jgi:hypothetical protein
VAWKRAIISPQHKKGATTQPGNYRCISLLAIPGKVYALLLMHRIQQHIDTQLHEAQCGFRKGRGTVDAIFAMRQLMGMCKAAADAPLFSVFIDLTKAYDSVNREALWQVLRVYDVPAKLVALLMDLHTGTMSAVRMGGQLGEWFETRVGVRQGCVIAPLLFNTFFDFVLRRALDQMRSGHGACGVQVLAGGPGHTIQPRSPVVCG